MDIHLHPDPLRASVGFRLRPRQLVACLSLALSASTPVPEGFARDLPSASRVSPIAHFANAPDATAAVNRVVTTCADSIALPDCSTNDDVTLRKALFCAQNKDTVDLTQLQCSTITLAEALVAGTISVTVNGPGRDKLTIDAGGRSRAFIHNGVYSNLLTINKLTIVNGHYDNPYDYSNGGGCIYSSSYVSVTSSTISNCYTSAVYKAATGGAIFARKGASLTDTIVTGSTAHDRGGHGSYGGGIVAGTVSLLRSTVSHNTVTTTVGRAAGGGVQGYTVFVNASTLYANGAGSVGGASYSQNIDVRNSTISGNYTFSNGVIGGVYARVAASVENSTIVGNMSVGANAAGLFIGLAATFGSAFVASTIISGNTAGGNAVDFGTPSGKTVLGGSNLIGAVQPGTNAPADTISADPKLGPLRANGGPTLTHALLPGSPAIDKGSNPAHLPFDQRGVPRTEGSMTDIGAFESDRLFRDGFDP
jgi:hypothetical protein